MRVLLTGSAGFIGTAIGSALEEAGDDVVRVDVMLEKAHGATTPPAGTHQLDVRDAVTDPAWAELLRGADVVVENFRPDVKDRLGLDYQTLRALNPRVILASVSGFGQTGPYRTRAGFDQVAQGMGGLMAITGHPGEGPMRAGIAVADSAAGLELLRSPARIDLLVTDIGLPGGMNGRQMAEAARHARPGLRTLFITGYAEQAVIGETPLPPGMHVMTKPFALEALTARIRDLVAG